MFTGAAVVHDLDDLHLRASLLFAECGLGHYLPKFKENMAGVLDENSLGMWLAAANNEAALGCMRDFARVEGNVLSSDAKGLGRISASSFPRLGAVLAKPARKAGVDSNAVTALVERTAQAGYLAALAVLLMNDEPIPAPAYSEKDALWQRWIPLAYRVPDGFMDEVSGIPAFVSFWDGSLRTLGMPKMADAVKNQKSDLNKSISGLVGVGVSLALVDRELGNGGV